MKRDGVMSLQSVVITAESILARNLLLHRVDMTHRLALPLFGDEVAPRFCVADEVLIVEVEDDVPTTRSHLHLAGKPWPERLSSLSGQGVTVLLCGGFNRRFMPLARRQGIQVIWGLAGTADDLIDAYCHGTVDAHRIHPGHGPGCGPRRPPRGGGRERGGRR
jgi:predicted Fe-Mo cluster-binding NifX family protein